MKNLVLATWANMNEEPGEEDIAINCCVANLDFLFAKTICIKNEVM